MKRNAGKELTWRRKVILEALGKHSGKQPSHVHYYHLVQHHDNDLQWYQITLNRT